MDVVFCCDLILFRLSFHPKPTRTNRSYHIGSIPMRIIYFVSWTINVQSRMSDVLLRLRMLISALARNKRPSVSLIVCELQKLKANKKRFCPKTNENVFSIKKKIGFLCRMFVFLNFFLVGFVFCVYLGEKLWMWFEVSVWCDFAPQKKWFLNFLFLSITTSIA